jgi:fatty-acyl-CoA synthase
MQTPSLLTSLDSVTVRFDGLVHALESAAAEGVHVWLTQGDQEPVLLSYRELLERSSRAADHFVSLGFERGDRVIIMLPTGEAWLVAFFGALLAGGVAVPVGPTFSFGGLERYAATIRHIAMDAGARIFVGGPPVEPYLPMLREGNPALRHFVRPEDLLTASGRGQARPSSSLADLAVLQYTSGTTGLPKGVMLSHRAVLSNAFMIGQRVGMCPRDTGVSWLPLFHDMGLIGALMTSLYWHYPLLLMPPESFLMHPRRWLQAITRVKATLTVAPNFAYQMAIDRIGDRHARDLVLDGVRCAFNGSEAVRPSTVSAFAKRFGPKGFRTSSILPVYGMAENTLAATFPPAGEACDSLFVDRRALEAGRVDAGARDVEIVSVGTPLSGVSVEIRDPETKPLAADLVGEVALRSPSMMDGYWQKPDPTSHALSDGWLRTGDLGFVHDGRLYLTGRVKELIIKRGRNYYPDDIERIASETAGATVLQAAAFSCPNERAGTEDIVIVLEVRALSPEDRERTGKEINGKLIGSLGIAADAILFVPPRTIPRTTSGKVQRAGLRSRYLEGAIGAGGE